MASMTETRVNTYTTGLQGHSSVVALADGGWVVTWHSDDGENSPYDIYQQRYNADGTVKGGEILVNSYTANSQDQPVVTALDDGGWAVAWMSNGVDSWNYGIEFQRYDDNGDAASSETAANVYFSDNQLDTQITTLASGQFLLTWTSYGQDGSGAGIYQRLFNADGTAASDEEQVNTTTDSDQQKSTLTALADGGWVVAWVSDGQDGSAAGIYQQRYGSDGVAVNGEILVNSYTTGEQTDPVATALADGGWVVAWTSTGEDGNFDGVFLRRYDAAGEAVGDDVQVNNWTTGQQSSAAITALEDGGWVVVWVDSAQSSSDIYSRRYDSDGNAVGDEWQVNVYGTGEQVEPAVTALSDGGYVITWTSAGQDGNDAGVFQQRFDADGFAYDDKASPIALASAVQGLQDAYIGFSTSMFAFSDTDGDALYSITITSLPTQGELFYGYDLQPVAVGQVIRSANISKLYYRGGDGEYGDAYASFGFEVTDSGGRHSEAASMVITLDKANQTPLVESEFATMTEGKTKIIDVMANDSDPDGDDLSFEEVQVESGRADVSVTDDGRLAVTYTGMDLAPGETAAISIYYSLSDGQASSDASLTITVQGVTEPGDDITGTRKDDTLKGTSEGERIFGRVGDDRIDGRAGEDTLFGEGGADRLTGGGDRDLLVFADNFGKDVVTDFDSAGKNRDVIELSDVAAITGYNDLMKHHVHDTGRNTVIDVGNDRITLQGIDLRDLGRDDFVF